MGCSGIKEKPVENQKKQNLDNLKDLLIDYDIPIIKLIDYKEIEKKIENETGFKPYYPQKILLNKNKQKINGTYFQYNKGCILYVLINGGWIDEKYVPDSMKFYKDHTHCDDERNDINLLKRCMSIIDLAQLWINIGGNCPYLEIDIQEVRNRIFLILKDYFKNPNTELMKKVAYMTWQNKDYFELRGTINVKYTPLREILNVNPCIKKAINENIIKNGDLIKFGRHFIIFDKIVEEEQTKFYVFQDSLSYFFKKSSKIHNNCNFDKQKGYIYTQEDTKLINIDDNDEIEIGILEVIN